MGGPRPLWISHWGGGETKAIFSSFKKIFKNNLNSPIFHWKTPIFNLETLKNFRFFDENFVKIFELSQQPAPQAKIFSKMLIYMLKMIRKWLIFGINVKFGDFLFKFFDNFYVIFNQMLPDRKNQQLYQKSALFW